MSERTLVRQIHRCWSRSRAFRITLVIALVYTVLRLAVQGVYLAVMLFPEQNVMGGMPGWAGVEGPMMPVDLQAYLDAAKRFQLGQDLYPKGSFTQLEGLYQYAPSFALACIPFLWLSPVAVTIIHTLLHIAAYALLYVWWGRIFRRLNLDRAGEILAWTLPVWLIFPAFWSDLGYLNIYTITALLSTLLIDAVLNERLGWSLLWLSITLQTKPQWAFAAAVPLLLGRHRFFFKLIALTLVTYVVVVGATILVIGPAYGWQQYVDYFQFLPRLSHDFPWRGPDRGFLGYNHSIVQIVVYLLGVTPGAMRLATGIKVLLLIPLAATVLRYLFQPIGHSGQDAPQISLDLAFALYLGAFIWLDMVWEVSLGIAVFTYLLATLERHRAKILVWAIWIPYISIDPLRLLGAVLAFGGLNTILPGPYILTDLSMHIPIVMIVILTFYALLVRRLWVSAPTHQVDSINWRPT
jgi:hypothetical protein